LVAPLETQKFAAKAGAKTEGKKSLNDTMVSTHSGVWQRMLLNTRGSNGMNGHIALQRIGSFDRRQPWVAIASRDE